MFSQLYRSGSFNSSGRGSTCDATDDMYSDVSLEDDVIDLNHRVSYVKSGLFVYKLYNVIRLFIICLVFILFSGKNDSRTNGCSC